MDRRMFLGTSAAGLSLSTLAGYVAAAESKPARVGLIGCGWFGKCDLFRLLQVAPVEVVSLCDVDRQMLAEAADKVAAASSDQEDGRALTATIARCSRSATWTSCWSPRRIIGTRCR